MLNVPVGDHTVLKNEQYKIYLNMKKFGSFIYYYVTASKAYKIWQALHEYFSRLGPLRTLTSPEATDRA